MNDISIIDARGLSCPQPALMTREAIKKLGKGSLKVLVDTDTAVENITRVAKNNGWRIKSTTQPGGFQLELEK